MLFTRKPSPPLDADSALPGRAIEMPVPERHEVLHTPLRGPFPDGVETAVFGMGCFWGAERIFWQTPGVYTTAVGYAGRVHAEPDLRGGVLGTDRPRRGRARRVRHRQDELRGDAAAVLGGPRSDPGHAPGQRRRQPVPLGDLLRATRPSGPPPQASRDAYQQMLSAAGPRRDHDRDRSMPDRRGRPDVLRRGLPPAVSRQEPRRLLRPRRHGRGLSRSA